MQNQAKKQHISTSNSTKLNWTNENEWKNHFSLASRTVWWSRSTTNTGYFDRFTDSYTNTHGNKTNFNNNNGQLWNENIENDRKILCWVEMLMPETRQKSVEIFCTKYTYVNTEIEKDKLQRNVNLYERSGIQMSLHWQLAKKRYIETVVLDYFAFAFDSAAILNFYLFRWVYKFRLFQLSFSK